MINAIEEMVLVGNVVDGEHQHEIWVRVFRCRDCGERYTFVDELDIDTYRRCPYCGSDGGESEADRRVQALRTGGGIMSKRQRNLDGIYYRVKRDGEWQNICYSDMTATERQDVIYERMGRKAPEEQARYYKRMAEIMADQLYDLGEQLGVMFE